MSQAAPLLREIKNIFNNQGINSDIQIASHLAFLLLIQNEWPRLRNASYSQEDFAQILAQLEHELNERITDKFQSKLPQSPARQIKDDNLREILSVVDYLKRALDLAPRNNAGDFFQHEVRFEILKDVRSASYPTPHHIASFIASLGLSQIDEPTVFDPAAGTGGLLAAALQQVPSAKLVGCDFDPNIAELGVGNLLLHQPKNGFTYHLDSALSLIERDTDSYCELFDSLLMNPPFGGSRSANETRELMHSLGIHNDFGRSTHSLLSVVGLFALKPGGQAAFLLPTGSLFGSGGEERLRTMLLQENNLEAVITLNKELFQPYSSVAAHLMVVQKGTEEGALEGNTDFVWFGDVIGDGYPSGAGRDLTLEQDSKINELPRMRDLVLRSRAAEYDTSASFKEDAQLNIILLRPKDGLPGVGVIGHGISIDSYQITALPRGLLLSLEQNRDENDSDQTSPTFLGGVHIAYEDGEPTVLLPESVQTVNWKDIFPASSWSNELQKLENPIWNGEAETATIETLDSSKLEIKTTGRGAQNYLFHLGEESPALACLIDENGNSLSPWLSLTDQENYEQLKNEGFGEKFSAQPVTNASNQRCGWIMSLSSNSEADEAIPPQASLLIIFWQSTKLFVTESSQTAARLTNGWLHINQNQQLLIEVGEPVELRRDPPSAGFAIGPLATGASEAYRIFAVAIAKEHLSTSVNGQDVADSFEPRRFLPEPPTEAVGHPSEIIANIRKNQARLGLQVDMLLNLLGGTSEESGNQHPLLYLLEDGQQRFWQLLSEQGQNADTQPFYFTPDDTSLLSVDDHFDEDFMQQQLDLFTKMGLVEAVHIGERNVYRLASVIDNDEAVS